jgi:hypothetical protein
MKGSLFLCGAFLLSSCDAFVSLPYYVENKSDQPVRIFVPHYQANGAFGRGVDTTLQIGPHSRAFIGSTMPRVTGPVGAMRRIYRESPGVCGVRLVKPDTSIALACTVKEWKLRRGTSVLKIRD